MNNVTTRKITLLVIILLILVVISLLISKLTSAYLAPTVSEDVVTKGEVTATGDNHIFTSGTALTLPATTDNFKTGGSNLTNTSNPSVKLVASSKTNKADATYYAGFIINSNSYNYSTSDNTAELLLTIKDNTGATITSIDGLTYTTSGGVSGFDITNKTGLFDVALNKAISTTSSSSGTTHTWTFTLTFVNLSTDQSINENSKIDIDVYMQQNPFLSSFIKSKYIAGSESTTGLYFHNSDLANGAGDNSYRYAGENPNNYLCLSTNISTACPDDNLFRIIGVFDGKVKLIRVNSIGNYYWDSNGSNTWSTSSLKKYLNEDYLASLKSAIDNDILYSKITDTTWKVGGVSISGVTAATMYKNEIKSTATGTDGLYELSAKVGLMYASDYGFAADSTAWTTTLYKYSGSVNGLTIPSLNWLYLGSNEWFISRNSLNSNFILYLSSSGQVCINCYDAANVNAVRPVFYLAFSSTYSNGDGSLENPYKLTV